MFISKDSIISFKESAILVDGVIFTDKIISLRIDSDANKDTNHSEFNLEYMNIDNTIRQIRFIAKLKGLDDESNKNHYHFDDMGEC